MGLRMPELLIIGFVVLLLFGPGKLAGLGQGLGEGIRGFKKALSGDDDKRADPQPAVLTSKAEPGDGARG